MNKEKRVMKLASAARSANPIAAALSMALLAFAGHVQAGRPFATEDAGVLAQKECEWESFAARARTRGEPRETGWSTQIGCGVGFKTQVALAFGRSKFESENTNALALGA
jgi:hypothetical protein